MLYLNRQVFNLNRISLMEVECTCDLFPACWHLLMFETKVIHFKVILFKHL